MGIIVHYRSIDRFTQRATFATLAGAQRFAQRWVGEHPDLGSTYAVSDDGVGRIMVDGDATLADLFPAPPAPPCPHARTYRPNPHDEFAVYCEDCGHQFNSETT
jgi:hypothetical protein